MRRDRKTSKLPFCRSFESVPPIFVTLSRVGAAIYEQEVYQSDRTAVFEADRQAADLQTALEGKLATMQGKNALAAHDAIQKEWTEGVTKIGGTLSNDRQKGKRSFFCIVASFASDSARKSNQASASWLRGPTVRVHARWSLRFF